MGKSIRLSVVSPNQTYTFDSTNEMITIGRSFKCDFNIPREDFSREHALFEVAGDHFYITDLGSKNGIHVDRIKLIPNTRTKISQDSFVVFSNIYQMKINALEILPQSNIILKMADPEMKTVTFNVNVDEEVQTPKKRPVKTKVRPEKNESIRMVAGFVTVVGLFLIYQAFG